MIESNLFWILLWNNAGWKQMSIDMIFECYHKSFQYISNSNLKILYFYYPSQVFLKCMNK